MWENVAGRTICFLQKRFCPKLIACSSPRFSLVLVRTFRLGRNALNECRVGQNLFEGHCDVQFRTCLYQTGAKLTSRGLGTGFPMQPATISHTRRCITRSKHSVEMCWGSGRDQAGGGRPHRHGLLRGNRMWVPEEAEEAAEGARRGAAEPTD